MHWLPGAEDSKTSASLDDWLKQATEVAGSWWPDYAKWLGSLSGEQVPARNPGDGANATLEEAPGTYVKM
jgi:polyhydroxyalkanoate synthase